MGDAIEIGIGLGSNLGRPPDNIHRALTTLAARGAVRPTVVSAIYRTAPWGHHDQNVFANACALAQTVLEPPALLAELKAVERLLGRTESFRWGPRLIDIDVLFYGSATVETPNLTIPHRELFARGFVLIPLAEIAPDLQIAGRSVAEAAAAVRDDAIAVWPDLGTAAHGEGR